MPPRLRLRHLQCLSQSSNIAINLFASHRPTLAPWQCIGLRYASILSSLSDNPSAYKKRIRVGRGPSSGKGKTSGRGQKGQKARGTVPFGFEGGQTPQYIVNPRRGKGNKNFTTDMAALNLDRIQSWIDQGRLNPYKPITIRELHKSNCINKIKDGVKLLGRGSKHLEIPIHIYVSRASKEAIAAIERIGGSVTTRYYTKTSIKRILSGETDPIHSRLFQSTPISDLVRASGLKFDYALPDPVQRRELEYYRDKAHRGYLSYQVPEGHGPSLFFRTPGTGIVKGKDVQRKRTSKSSDTRLW